MAARRITVESAARNDWKALVPGRVPVLLVIALGLFIAAAIALTYNLARLKESFVWVEHTNAVIRNISAFERALLQAESGERGYLLTGDSSYLDSYTRAQGEIPGLLDSLKQLVSDNPTQTQRLNELRPNIEARLAEFKEAIELGPARLSEALAILMKARSSQLTPQIEEQLGRLRSTELSLLEERQHSAERTTLLVTFFASAMGILGLLSAAFGSFHLERQRTISQLRAANDDLTKSHEALRNREAHLQAILATVPDAMVVIDSEGLIQNFGAIAQRLFGYSEQEVQGKNVSMLMPEAYRQNHNSYLARYLATGEKRIIGIGRVVVGQRKDGSIFPMELSVGEIASNAKHQFVGFVRDLTMRQERDRLLNEMQAELLHVSRLSTMGEMASALAHELNQPLSAVTNYLQGSKRLLENNPDERAGLIRDALEKAAEQALRAGQVIQRVRDFVARGETETRIESINKLIEEASALALVASKDHPVRISLNFDPNVNRVLVDKVQIQQVLLNLLRNAIEAMQSSERPELIVSTMPVANDMIAVSVSDNGPGIEPEVLSKLFQPFVSTKRQGMGIGLSICRTIINSHGGQIAAEPNPDGGATFRFTLRGVSAEELDGA